MFDAASSINNVSSSIDIMIEKEINTIKQLSPWHGFSREDVDNRINSAYDLWNSFIMNNVSFTNRSDDTLTRIIPLQVKSNHTKLSRSKLESDLVSEFNNFSWMSKVHRAEAILAGRLEGKPRGISMSGYSTNAEQNTLYTTSKNSERMCNAALEMLNGK